VAASTRITPNLISLPISIAFGHPAPAFDGPTQVPGLLHAKSFHHL
jgi:hypothetical protein